jgi:hypothetical protein
MSRDSTWPTRTPEMRTSSPTLSEVASRYFAEYRWPAPTPELVMEMASRTVARAVTRMKMMLLISGAAMFLT